MVGIQTVPRSELRPWEMFLEHTAGDGTYHTGHDSLVKGLRKGKDKRPFGLRNADMWHHAGLR